MVLLLYRLFNSVKYAKWKLSNWRPVRNKFYVIFFFKKISVLEKKAIPQYILSFVIPNTVDHL